VYYTPCRSLKVSSTAVTRNLLAIGQEKSNTNMNKPARDSKIDTDLYNLAFGFLFSASYFCFNILLRIFPLTLFGISFVNLTPPLNFL